ncbi:hypothetical protein TNCV_2548101 [Trichonephila clavipes]|nr:hypothetical protein TNCV_2548101 [Trichonephila clavipes]
MPRSGGQSEARPPVFKSPSKPGTHLLTHCSRDERLSRPCPGAPSIHHDAFPNKPSGTTPTVSFSDISMMKPCPYPPWHKLELRITAHIEMILINK